MARDNDRFVKMKHKFLILAWAAMVVALASCSKEEEKTEEVADEPAAEEVEFAYGQGQYSGVVLPYRKAVISASGEAFSHLSHRLPAVSPVPGGHLLPSLQKNRREPCKASACQLYQNQIFLSYLHSFNRVNPCTAQSCP